MDRPKLSSPAPRPSKPDPLGFGILLSLGVLVLIAFAPAFNAMFVSWDDQEILVNNPHFRGFGPDNLRWMFSSTLLGHYQPLTWLSYAIDHALWGMNARGYHATNIAIHLVNVLLVFVLALKLIGCGRSSLSGGDAGSTRATTRLDLLAAGLGAAIWGVHPLRVESVAWVTERRDVLSALFLLLSVLAYLRSVEVGKLATRSAGWLFAAAALLGVSLLCKAWGMTLFVMLLALDVYPLRRVAMDPRRWLGREGFTLLIQKWPMVLLGIVAAAMAAHAQHSAIATKTLEQWSISNRIVQSIHGVWFYIRSSVLPIDLSPLYELPRRVNPLDPQYLVAYFCVGVGLAMVIGLRHRLPALVPAAGVYVIALLPVLGILQSGDQFVADRYSYIAMIGFSILCGVSVVEIARRVKAPAGRWCVAALSLAIVGVLVARSNTQTRVWDNTIALWTQAARAAPGALTHTNLAIALLDQSPPDRSLAAQHLVLALRANPDDGRAWFTLGNTLRAVGKLKEAEEALLYATRLLPQAYMAHVNLGSLYLNQLNRPQEAIVQFRAAIQDIEKGLVSDQGQRRPISATPYLALGNALRVTGDIAGARNAFEQALKFDETRDAARKELDATPLPGK